VIKLNIEISKTITDEYEVDIEDIDILIDALGGIDNIKKINDIPYYRLNQSIYNYCEENDLIDICSNCFTCEVDDFSVENITVEYTHNNKSQEKIFSLKKFIEKILNGEIILNEEDNKNKIFKPIDKETLCMFDDEGKVINYNQL